MVIVEKSFPRGGTIVPRSKTDEIEFGARQEKRKKDKSKKKSKNDASTDISEDIQAVSAELLSHKTIQEGMIIMGLVKSVDPTFLQISLPGRIAGRVLASGISESYNKVLRKYVDSELSNPDEFKPLPELFHVGQVLYTKVMEISNTEHGRIHINLSLKPEDVHSNFNHQQLRKGQMFCGAVEEVHDHGYVIESGIKNLRCFLPYDSSEKGLNVGQLVFMRIEKITQTPAASTAVCRSLSGGNRKVKDLADPNLDYILPSVTVNFTITKALKDGLQGTIMNGAFTAYVNEHQLENPLHVPADYEVNSTVNARVLYVMPLSKLVYLSLRTNPVNEEGTQLKRGTIVDEATVHHTGTGGIILDLEGKGKGLISFNSIKSNFIGNYDQDEIFAKYKKNSKHKVRVLEYDIIDHLYTCSDNPGIVNEKFYTLEDLKPGEFVTGIIEKKDSSGGYFVRVGNVRGLIEKMFLAATAGNLQENAKIRCRVTWTHPERNIVYLTNRNEYMSKTAKLLMEGSAVKANRVFVGTIVKIHEKCYIVRFFGNIKGILYRNQISGYMSNETLSFYVGATMSFRIVSKDGDKIVLGLAEEMHKIGEVHEATITNIIQNGLEVAMAGEGDEQVKGLVPVRLLSDFQELVAAHLKTYSLDEQVTVACVLKNLYSIRDVREVLEHPVKHWKDVRPGDIFKGWVKNVENEIIEVLLPIRNFDKLVKVHLDMFLERAVNEPNIVLVPDQTVYVKVLSKEVMTKTLNVTAKLTEVWDCELKSTGQCFAQFLDETKKIRKRFKALGKPISAYSIGDKVTGTISNYSKLEGDWIVELPDNVNGVIKAAVGANDKNMKVGKEVECSILWIDYSLEVLYLTHRTSDSNHISKGLSLDAKYRDKVGINAKILLQTSDFAICSLKKGQNPLIFVPAKLHVNDFESTMAASMKEGEFCRLAFIHDKYPIAVLENTWKLWKRIGTAKRKIGLEETNTEKVPAKKRKVLKETVEEDSHETITVRKRNYVSLLQNSEPEANGRDDLNLFFKDTGANSEKDTKKTSKRTNTVDLHNKKLRKEDTTDEEEHRTNNKAPHKKTKVESERHQKPEERPKHKKPQIHPVLPGANDFWSTDLTALDTSTKAQSESSDEENEHEETSPKKKKKLTAAEKFKAAREEEARLRQIEENYANPNKQPETADEFDRLVLANPNSSMTWINYMVFHLQAAEIDKARSIARRALKSISFREEQEIINVWVALLNLELRYGTKDTFTEILKESTLCNDSFKIYSRCLQILSDAKKVQELNELVPTVTKKFKEKPEIWKYAANAYFEVGLVDKAKQLLNRALTALPERDHINTIVTFANLNHKYDDKETAHTLLDQIVTSYPKRVDVWSQYVDMLIKDNDIESARRTLERAVAQKIPIKKMRTLFKKYLEFEEKFGNEETVQNVKDMAANYVKNEISS